MNVPSDVKTALDYLEKNGFEAYIVGGAVRDWLRGITAHDFDICTSAQPNDIKRIFSMFKTIDTGIKHGTVSVIIKEKPLEITTFRKESGYEDNRHPDFVEFVDDIKTDLARRDFTINAMAYNPKTGIIDPFDGKSDIKNKIIRAVGNPEVRFKEDALRIMRGLRFSAQTGFIIEEKTQKAMIKCCDLLENIASERISAELLTMLCGRYAGSVLRKNLTVLSVILPELKKMNGLNQKNPYHIYDILEHSIRAMEQMPADPVMRFTALYHDAGKPLCMTVDEMGIGHFYGHPEQSENLAKKRCEILRFSSNMQNEICFLTRHHDIPIETKPHIIRRRLAKYGENRLRRLIMLQKADSIARGTHPEYLMHFANIVTLLEEVLTEKPCLTVRNLAIGGKELLELGLRGKEIGQMQHVLLEYVIQNPDKNTSEQLIDEVKRRLSRE